MMTRQSMARVSSASPEADFVAPAAVQTPFDWEAAPGTTTTRKTSSKSAPLSGNFYSAERESDEAPSLPLPPGRRPKDGFYLPFSREPPDLEREEQLESGAHSSRPRKLFNLKFPGSSRKPSSTMRQPFQSSSKPPKARDEESHHVDQDHQGFTIFNPLSGHRFGSSITNRMLMQFQKKQSLWRRCLPSKPESGSSSHIQDPNRGRRLDEGFNDEGFNDEAYVTAADSPGHGHRPNSSNSSPIATKQQSQVTNSSRFMASMLISLCPDDAGDSQFDADQDGNSDDYNDEIGIPHLTTPRTKSSSPEAFEIEMDPASQVTVTSQEKCTCTCRHGATISARVVDSSTPQVGKTFRSVSRSLQEELATARSPSTEHSRSGKLVQPRSRGTEDSTDKFINAADQNDSADAHPVFFKASSNRELLRSRETCISSFSWKRCTEKGGYPVADLAAAQEPGRDFDQFADELPISEDEGEEHERRGRDRIFSPGSNRSSSPEFNSLHKAIWSRPNSLSPSITKEVDTLLVSKPKNSIPHSMVGYLSPPRISFDDLEYTSNSSDSPKAFARWRSTAAEPSVLRRSSLESERKQSPATRVLALNSVSPLQKQALQRSTKPSRIRIRDLKQSSSLRPTPSKAFHGIDDTGESGDDEFGYSTDASGYETSSAVSSPSNSASPKPASPKLLKSNLHSQPRIGPFMVDQESTSVGPSLKQIMLARSYSVRSSSSRRLTPQEYQADTYFRGPSHPPPASRLAKTSSSSVMSKVALFESKAGLISKSGPLCYT